ncbi:hypothetical protein C3R19_24125, partial [Blautia producta]
LSSSLLWLYLTNEKIRSNCKIPKEIIKILFKNSKCFCIYGIIPASGPAKISPDRTVFHFNIEEEPLHEA